MDNMASAKALSSTPFSINDILTRNNTSIFRRIPESPPLAANDRRGGDFHQHHVYHKYRQCDSPIPDNVSSDTEDVSKVSPYERRSPVFYYNNNNNHNNNNDTMASGYPTHGSSMANRHGRRRSLECFLAAEDNAMGHRRKSEEYFMKAETALDMRRRCTSNDSGEHKEEVG